MSCHILDMQLIQSGGLEHEFYFTYIGNVIIPTDGLYFWEGLKPPTSSILVYIYIFKYSYIEFTSRNLFSHDVPLSISLSHQPFRNSRSKPRIPWISWRSSCSPTCLVEKQSYSQNRSLWYIWSNLILYYSILYFIILYYIVLYYIIYTEFE